MAIIDSFICAHIVSRYREMGGINNSMIVKDKSFTPHELAEFLRLQRLSFSILETMAGDLVEGQSEQEVGRELVRRYRAAGVGSFFHLPVVLFGERTALPGDWTVGHFFPKKRALRAGDSVVLDAAPLFRGYMVDTSYAFCFGTENPVHRAMMAHLGTYRTSVCAAVNAGVSFREIALDVEQGIRAQGYEPVHCKHPGAVLGHRAVKRINLPFTWRTRGFDAVSLGWFTAKNRLALRGWAREDPLWNTSPQSAHRPHDGLWLVEPHAGCGEVGAKWEDILVIEHGKARWLDDMPPHTWQWSQIAAGNAYDPRPEAAMASA